jgi:hypothetical protein
MRWMPSLARLRLRRPGPPRHRCGPTSGIAAEPGPTGDWEFRKPAVAAFSRRRGQLVALAYCELDLAATGSPEQIRTLGMRRLLPRPWEPASCRTPQLREQLWSWLDAVVGWLVTE